MTENKRFTVTNISANGMKGLFKLGNDTLSIYDVARLINELLEENEQLEFQNSNLMKEVAEYSRKAKELEKENEQLKKELKRCRNWLNSDKNDYELTLAFIKNKGYSLKDVLEYEKELKSE